MECRHVTLGNHTVTRKHAAFMLHYLKHCCEGKYYDLVLLVDKVIVPVGKKSLVHMAIIAS